ncbi:MAG: PEP-CTERM sorting domain-containing protein [Rivularia sp. (in: cyanobacteria)]
MTINKLFSSLSIGAMLATVITVAANPAQAGTLTTINFDENVGVGSNPFKTEGGGPKLDNLWSDYGLKMDSSVKELWLYDSDCEGKTCTGDDPDLATGKGENKNGKYKSPEQGKLLIIQENNTNEADDYAPKNETEKPGTITFDFTDDTGVLFDSIGLLDFDDPGDPIFSAVFADGTTTGDFTYNSNFFKERGGQDRKVKTKADNIFEVKNNKKDKTYISQMKLLSTNWEESEYVEGNNSLREYDFDFNGKKVTQFNLTLPGSGAITGLNYYREAQKPVKRKVPEPTSILGLVAMGTVVASSLKRKRNSNIELV